MKSWLRICTLFILYLALGKERAAMADQRNMESVSPPPNKAADFALKGNRLKVQYNGGLLFDGAFDNKPEDLTVSEVESDRNGVVDKVLVIRREGGKVLLTGSVFASEESFPCEADRKGERGQDLVRNSYGLSHSLLNRAVYDRKWDWVLSFDQPASVRVTPAGTTSDGNRFEVTVQSSEVALRFRPRFYQKHRGLSHFEPWKYQVWKEPVVGWSSWYAYLQDVDEAKMRAATDALAEKMKPYGLEYIQIDDGYQQTPTGFPETWIKPNAKFPSGMDGLAKYISNKGLKPAVWTNVSFADNEAARTNKQLFVRNASGEPAWGRWVAYSLDGSNPEAIDRIIRPVYRGFKEMGWRYFKVDSLRHLRCEGYNSNAGYFGERGAERAEAFRNVVQAVREEIGRDNFLLACWGVMPELVGVVDGCRLGGDGYGYECLAQYNSFNNVVWLNDPDHIELNEKEAYRSCTATSLAGALFLVTDKAEKYAAGEGLAPALASIPVLFTMPGQLYDLDPSRSMHLDRADVELSGTDCRAFDGTRETSRDLFLLEVNKPFENWVVLGRMGERVSSISFANLGLEPDADYLVFDFWAKEFRGVCREKIEFEKIDPRFNCQVYCIRKKQDHPQVLATSRHISCGGLELRDLAWADGALRGTSQLVARDPYVVYVWEPDGAEYEGVECRGAEFQGTHKTGSVREVKILSPQAGEAQWTLRYKRPGSSQDSR
jgi:alpha-galactosidase